MEVPLDWTAALSPMFFEGGRVENFTELNLGRKIDEIEEKLDRLRELMEERISDIFRRQSDILDEIKTAQRYVEMLHRP